MTLICYLKNYLIAPEITYSVVGRNREQHDIPFRPFVVIMKLQEERKSKLLRRKTRNRRPCENISSLLMETVGLTEAAEPNCRKDPSAIAAAQ